MNMNNEPEMISDTLKKMIDLSDPTIEIAASLLDDMEHVRIANQHRLRIMIATEPDSDGISRGHGYPLNHPTVNAIRDMVVVLLEQEEVAIKQLEKAIKAHPMGDWIKEQKGIGFKQAGRLLSVIGDPYLNRATGKVRTVSQLWSYCGFSVVEAPHPDDPEKVVGVAPRRKKGVKANWSTNAKTRAFLIASSCLRQRTSPYRAVYDARRAHTDITHPEWTDGHSHHDALRIMSKHILKKMWIEARRLHYVANGLTPPPDEPPFVNRNAVENHDD